jgi:hypothetical protein
LKGAAGYDEPNRIGWGTGNSGGSPIDAAATQTGLSAPASEARVAGASSQQTVNQTNDTYQSVGTLTADANKTIYEAALFDSNSGGRALMRAAFDGMALNLGDSIQFTLRVRFS